MGSSFLKWLVAGLWFCLAPLAAAQEFSALARLDMSQSAIFDQGRGVEVRLALSQGVPWRVLTLEAPERLVLDFREVDWQGAEGALAMTTDRVRGLRMGQIRPGWSRMVVDLAGPHVLETAGLEVDRQSGAATLRVRLGVEDAARFSAMAGVPEGPGWEAAPPSGAVSPSARDPDAPLRVMIDPGHGGIDPGAEVEGLQEKHLMLVLARELREALMRAGGFEVWLTREGDEFVSLEGRVALAHRVGADVFVSLHADALSDLRARGASVYTLSDSASDAASAALAERHDRADILAGVDLSGTDDIVAGVLMDLARQETQPRAAALAASLLDGLRAEGIPLLSRPLRHAGFSVLKAPDIPSVLVETGFLSNERDRRQLSDPAWRTTLVVALRDALIAWQRLDAARAGLVRQ
ncbi:N-acetylmuramoyl-L-alanine amidase [Roseovarius autotrophicus]|uniref:N-acetylmuramoyl-L-alanine amidase n=1 Tax=Roseovarius autotrophicus TaxID=2824121 RepID=UPI0019D97CA9|nr:N-acetylmuramoyl-L-alanine amidase [Roseovarius autotrophicus]MBE0454015.1 N-acetylmuramoyl-L-alanine amidase [Roseovarius sp.]